MIKRIMKRLGWVPASELEAARAETDRNSERMYQWSEDLKREHEREYRELAERWAETREHLFDRQQLHTLQRVMLNYVNTMPPAPIIIEKEPTE